MEQKTVGHPKGLYLLFATEMWERFSFYGMRAIFKLFLLNAMLMQNGDASKLYGNFAGLVYLTPLIGGYIADKYWGNRRSIVVGGILMAVGQFFLFATGLFYEDLGFANPLLYSGLFFIIIGNGFFKPNISTMVGQLYPAGDKRMDSAMTIFYMGINAGALLSPLICGTLGEVYDSSGAPVLSAYKYGFLAAAIGMVVSLIIFISFKNKYLISPTGKPLGMPPASYENKEDQVEQPHFEKKQLIVWGSIATALISFFTFSLDRDFIESCMYGLAIAMPGLIITDKTISKEEKNQIWVIYILAFFVIFFWAAFEQAGNSLTDFAAHNLEPFFGIKVKASYFQVINPAAIVILAPLVSALWLALKKKNIEPSSPLKQALGLFFVAIGYLVLAWAVKGKVGMDFKISMAYVVILYVIHTVGELCLSPIGLSMVVKLSPVKFSSLLMGVWFLSSATANVFSGQLGGLRPDGDKIQSFFGVEISTYFSFFMVFVVMCAIAGVLLFVLSKKLTKMAGDKL